MPQALLPYDLFSLEFVHSVWKRKLREAMWECCLTKDPTPVSLRAYSTWGTVKQEPLVNWNECRPCNRPQAQ